MACSVCREAGHTKRNCPKEKEEKVRIQRDRTNMFIQILPALLANPILQGLMWWQISKLIPNANYLNTTIVGAEIIDIFVPDDITPNIPQGVVFGAVLQETENSDEYVKWLKKKVVEGTPVEKGIGQQIDLSKFFSWLSDIAPDWAEQKTYTT